LTATGVLDGAGRTAVGVSVAGADKVTGFIWVGDADAVNVLETPQPADSHPANIIPMMDWIELRLVILSSLRFVQ
jgi:hypothetical protein